MDRMKRVLALAAALMPFCGAALAEASVFGTRLVNSWDAAQVRGTDHARQRRRVAPGGAAVRRGGDWRGMPGGAATLAASASGG